ncbi:MAG: hypothetical protein CSA36_01605 [Draconibacterium sp.]|nr:MAG: hypothetical protein CSA36_01605 [Draconibacterium sp.]
MNENKKSDYGLFYFYTAAYFYSWALPFAAAYSAIMIDPEYSKTLSERAAKGYKMSNDQYRNHPYFQNLDW